MASSPRKQPTRPSAPTSAAQWRARQKTTVELPSGSHAVLRRPGMDKFLEEGFLPDKLRKAITAEIASASRRPTSVASLTKELKPEELSEWLDTLDRVCTQVFENPPVRWHRRVVAGSDGQRTQEIPDEERDYDRFLYTDEIGLEDKQFAFQYAVGGSADLERFRAQTRALVAGVPTESNLEVPAEPGPAS